MKTHIFHYSNPSLFSFHIYTTMLKDPTSFKAHGAEYQKLENAWQDALSLSLLPLEINMDSTKTGYPLSSLLHLFDEYMTQVWTNSQIMLQSSRPNDSRRTSLPPCDESFSLNILGLQLMKQSLRTRKEFLCIVNELNNTLDMDHVSTDVTEYASTLGDEEEEEEEEKEEEKEKEAKQYYPSPDSKDSSYFSSDYHKPFKLTSSPSSPVIGSTWRIAKEEASCSHNFKPASNYLLYYGLNADARHSNLCHLCKQNIALKKSISADNLNGLINDDSDGEEEYLEQADYGVMLLDSECSDDMDDIDEETRMMASKLLIEDNDEDVCSAEENHFREKLQKYNLIEQEGSSKIELDSLESGASSSSLASPSSYFSVDEALKAPESDRQYGGLTRSRPNSSSTYLPQSIYSSNNDSGRIATNQVTVVSAEHTSQKIDGATKKLIKIFLNKNKSEEEHNVSLATAPKNTKLHSSSSFSITRTLSNNINLCNIFSSRKPSNKVNN
jgi:hypothetical protein